MKKKNKPGAKSEGRKGKRGGKERTEEKRERKRSERIPPFCDY